MTKLQAAIQKKEEKEKLQELSKIIQPYIQLVTSGVSCEQTGLLLNEIWRYFRYNWVNSYNTLPGRSMSLLIRDEAAPNHPIIGIAGLGSSVAQQGVHDKSIGWEKQTIIANLIKNPTKEAAKWLLLSLNNQIQGWCKIYCVN